eukprot:scaffold345_cov134-Cylindrotheca_fusiformis.AAC.93
MEQSLQFLLESDHCVSFDDEDGFVSLESRQARCCQDLTLQLREVNDHKTNIRDVFQCKLSDLTPKLCALLSHRVDQEALLPATQDAEANEEVLSDTTNAMTLTFPAMAAAELYVSLLAMPGALGSGLVELEALTALTAIVRRWALECCGRENMMNDRFQHRRQKSPTKSPPKKRSRSKGPIPICSAHSGDDEEEDGSSDPGPSEILQIGLQAAHALCEIPAEREFSTWSSEARESLLESVVSVFATSAAMKNLHSLCPDIVDHGSKSLQAAIEHCTTKSQLHEAAVVILRGLLRILQFKEVLPNGERGKLDAHAAAAKALDGLIQNVARTDKSSTPEGTQTPSRKGRRSSFGRTPATNTNRRTPRSQRRRVSLDGVTPMLSPALKKGRQSPGCLTPTGGLSKLDPVLSVFLGMLQRLATSPGFERASARIPTVEALQTCAASLPLPERAHFLRYLLKLCQSKVSIHRLVACEIIGNFLSRDWLQTHVEDTVEGNSSTPTSPELQPLPAALWKALQGRLVDRIAAVRARAASALEMAIKTNSCCIQESLLSALRKRAVTDETATVRKASISGMTQILLIKKDWMSEWYLGAFCELCLDHSLLTRKIAADSITILLLAYSGHHFGSMLEEAWSKCVLPMVLDEEAGTKAVALVDRVVISPILEGDDEDQNLSMWRILAHVGNSAGQQGSSKEPTQALQVALKQITIEDSEKVECHLLDRAISVAHKAVQAEASESLLVGVWCLLENLLVQLNDIRPRVKKLKRSTDSFVFCINAWKIVLGRQSNSQAAWLRGTLRSSFLVASRLAQALDPAMVEECRNDLKKEIKVFSFTPDVISAAISALGAMHPQSGGREVSRREFAATIREIFSCCEEELTRFVQHAQADRENNENDVGLEEKVVRALFTVGELSMIGFCRDDDDQRMGPDDKEADFFRGMHEGPSPILQKIVQSLLSSHLPGPKKYKNLAPLRAHAFTVLGKLCLRDERLTKSSLNLLARELHPSAASNPAVQSNVLLVLGDLSVRYTNMTDRYLPVLASCLQSGTEDPEVNMVSSTSSSSAVVRKHAVLLLSSLLLQDYIKWRGLLFHRFLVACSDDDEGVAHLAENVLSGPLWVRSPKLFYNHFVESLFVLNKCTAHPIYLAAASHGDGGSGIAVGFEGIHLNGEVGQIRRRRMYDFLLSKLSDEEKIGVTARLAKEVLACAVANNGDLGKVCEISADDMDFRLESAWNVMNDVFYVLSNKAIKVGKIVEDDALEDPNIPSASRQVTVAKSRLLSKISRKQLIEIVLPVLCNLKVKLQQNCSPLLKQLMQYLCEIFQSYKKEAREFLANDPTLLHEIEYDARQIL